MKVDIQDLFNRVNDLRKRKNFLFVRLNRLGGTPKQESITIKTIERFLLNDDIFNLSIALDVLEQAYKLDKAFEIIKEKQVDIGWFIECLSCGKPLEVYNDRYDKIRSCDGKDYHFMQLTQEEYDLLKEYFNV